MNTDMNWVDHERFLLGGLNFTIGGPQGLKTSLNEVIIRKPRFLLDFYVELFSHHKINSALEIGMYEGGSALCLALLFPELKLSSIDLREPNPAVVELVAPYGERLKLHYRTSQDDAEALARIHRNDFGGAPLDMVTDDASHFYELTRRTFEISFPMLKPGGVYVIEDWAWAHWAGWQDADHPWRDKPAMTNFIFELVMASASSPAIISKVECDAGVVVVHKAKTAGFGQPLNVTSLWSARGKSLTLI